MNARWGIAIVVGCGIFLAAVFGFIASRHYTGDGFGLAPPQGDALIYQQYARAMAEGHPYHFMKSDPPSTGSTSHLYPALLAGAYAAGFRGELLTIGAFLLNALLFLVYLGSYWLVARKLFSDAAPLALALALLSGHAAYSFFAQSDMGLFTAVAFGAWAAALYKRPVLCGAALFLACWTRPEGAILSAMMMAVHVLPAMRGNREAAQFALAGLAGLIGWAGVMGLNYALTGTTTFYSVLGKGGFEWNSAHVIASAQAALELVLEAFFGLDTGERIFYCLPIVGAVLFVVGLVYHLRHESETVPRQIWWLVSAGGATILVAASGWQGVQHDRYLAWILPAGLIYAAGGLRWIVRRRAHMMIFNIGAVVLIGYQAVGLVHFARVYAAECAYLRPAVVFAKDMSERVAPDTRLGTYGLSGLAYYLPEHYVANVTGITSPAFAHTLFVPATAEILKHRERTRLDAWLVPTDAAEAAWIAPFVGNPILVARPDEGISLGLYTTQWERLTYPDDPLSREIQRVIAGRTRVDSLDVGFTEDESRANYWAESRAHDGERLPFVRVARIGDRHVADVGRFIDNGLETFQVVCEPDRDLIVVARTSNAGMDYVRGPLDTLSRQEAVTGGRFDVAFRVDGGEPQQVTEEVSEDGNAFSEILFTIPSERVRRERITVTIHGRYFIYGYWFYQ